MVDPLWPVLAVATAAPFAVGLLPVLGRGMPERGLHALLGITAGLLLGVAFLDLIPEAIGEGGADAGLTLGVSFLALYGIEWVMGLHGHGGGHGHGHGAGHAHPDAGGTTTGDEGGGGHFDRRVRFPLLALSALAVHTFVDGLVLPSAFEAGTEVGITAGLAVAAHQAPDGFAAATVLMARGASNRAVLGGVALIALLTPVGALAGLPLAGEPTWLPHLLAVAAGTFIFVAAAEILPELHHGPHRGLVLIATALGFALVFGVGLLGLGHA